MGGGGLPGKIVGARSCKMRSVSCRGRFGRGTAKQGRDRKFQAANLRGKILNVEKDAP
jgi:DNA gyrase/topoisomerase IV subunit B